MTNPILRHLPPAGAAAATVTVRSPRFDDDDASAPVYTVKVPTRRDRVELDAALTEAGIRFPTDAELRECIRADLKANVADWKTHVATVDAVAEQAEAAEERTRAFFEKALAAETDEERERLAAELSADPGAVKVDQDLLDAYAAIVDDVRRNSPAFRRLEADRKRWTALFPVTVAALFTAGWKNLVVDEAAVPFRRSGGRVPEDLLDKVPGEDVQAISQAVVRLLSVSRQAEKNSGSPSGSSSGRPSSTSGAKPRTGARGKSTRKSTESTRATK